MTEAAEQGRPSLIAQLAPVKDTRPWWVQRWEQSKESFDDVGGMTILLWDAIRASFVRPFEYRELINQIESMGVRSVSIALITAVFVGMVMTVQFAFGLERFGATDYVGRVIGLSITRELAPSLTALVVGSRIGSGMAAELGAMSVTEQIDAIRALGADPVKKLVVPRLLACVVLIPVLALFADVVGFGGAMVVANLQFDTPMGFFFRTALESINMQDFLSGVGKAPFFGVTIAIIGCYYGMHTRGGTEGVGRSTTRTVVASAVAVLVTDFFLTKFFLSL
ncbi:MAG: ABC transporter permease [Myxococcales bacterium]|nr:ABC transporter permease [Myxococcales bacterium]